MFKIPLVALTLALASLTTVAEGAFQCTLVDECGVAHESDWMMKFERGARASALTYCEEANPNDKSVCDENHRVSMNCVFDPFY